MTMLNFEQRWQAARALENGGDLAAAKAIYAGILDEEPDRLYVRMRLSALEQSLGHYRLAREHALQMVPAVVSGRWRDIVPVARRLLSFDEYRIACGLIEGSDWARPEILDSASALALYLCLGDRVECGLQLADQAIAAGRLNAATSYTRANALRYSGRMQDATSEYERCIDLDPGLALCHWSLAYHQKSQSPGSRVERIKCAQAGFAADAPEQSYFHYALFKEHDDAGNVDDAWASLMSGCKTKRGLIRYEPAIEEKGVDALLRQSTPDFVRAEARGKDDNPSPIFIVGLPRSGTTLLERILGSHSEVRAAGELGDFNSALSWEADTFLGNFVTPDGVAALNGVDFRQAGAIYKQRSGYRAEGKTRYVDKNPANFFNTGYILKALPDSKIICLNRNPMDACFSNLKELFPSEIYGYSYDLNELADHYRRFVRLRNHWLEVAPDRFHVVEYENLVADPDGTAQRLMEFCGLPFEPGCVDITKNTASVLTASSSQIRQPIHGRGVGAWRKYAGYLEPLRTRIADAR